jgi:hypothetical protein
MSAELPAKKEILHEAQRWKSAQALKTLTPQEESLIAVDKSREAHASPGANFDTPIEQARRSHLHGKTTCANPRPLEQALRFRQCPRFERTIGVQEKEHIPRRLSAAHVHLQRSAARPMQEQVCVGGVAAGGIAATAVHDDNLVWPVQA